MDDRMDDDTGAREFHRFSELPTEIRLMVWEFAVRLPSLVPIQQSPSTPAEFLAMLRARDRPRAERKMSEELTSRGALSLQFTSMEAKDVFDRAVSPCTMHVETVYHTAAIDRDIGLVLKWNYFFRNRPPMHQRFNERGIFEQRLRRAMVANTDLDTWVSRECTDIDTPRIPYEVHDLYVLCTGPAVHRDIYPLDGKGHLVMRRTHQGYLYSRGYVSRATRDALGTLFPHAKLWLVHEAGGSPTKMHALPWEGGKTEPEEEILDTSLLWADNETPETD